MKTRFVVSLLVCVLVVVIGTVFFAVQESAPGKEVSHQKEKVVPVTTVTDSFKKGVHSISGTIVVPNPCVSITTDAAVDTTASPVSIRVNIATAQSEGICLQQAQTKTFSLQATATSSAAVSVFVDGVFSSQE